MDNYTSLHELRCLLYSLNDLECRIEKIINQHSDHPIRYAHLTRAEAAEFMGCSLRNLDRIVEDYFIPKEKDATGHPYFLKADLISALGFISKDEAREYRMTATILAHCDKNGRPIKPRVKKKSTPRYLKGKEATE